MTEKSIRIPLAVLAAVIMAVAAYGALRFAESNCADLTRSGVAEARWDGPLEGCRVRMDGEWVPYSRWAEIRGE
ncbi:MULTISPECIES: hypothetical protein [Catenuloplanes]|uniref:Uncharacterized protein n=1 Tax=Catenuloplanes niger TaxID=587534 RepID=A0AAE4CVY0_9ACTN|nr:hypothetical protein [Catenuloplanes niger]MDR7325917.1 hypothetical protein [Catenuloplanes niger]